MKLKVSALLLSLLLSALAHAGAVLKVSIKDASGKLLPNEIYYAQDGMMRIDSLDPQGNVDGVYIVRDGVIWQIQPLQRTFTRIDQQSLAQMMGAGNAHLSAMMANLPPERRAMLQAQLAQRAAASAPTFTDTGRSDRKGGYACHIWEESQSSSVHGSYCVVPAPGLPAGDELELAMKKAAETASVILAGMPGPQAQRMAWFGKLNGFPVSWEFGSASQSADREHVLTSAEAQHLPADKFAIPQGFTERPLRGSSVE